MDYSYTTQTTKQLKHFPLKAPILFDTANFNAIQTKVIDFNKQFVQEKQSCAMNEQEVELFNGTMKILSETSRYHVSTFSQSQYDLIFAKLLHWPTASLFPILDIIRSIIIHPSSSSRTDDWKKLLPTVIDLGFKGQAVAANQLLILRLIANLFRWENIHSTLQWHGEQLLSTIADCVRSDNKNIRTALVTVLLNFSVLYTANKSQEGKNPVFIRIN